MTDEEAVQRLRARYAASPGRLADLARDWTQAAPTPNRRLAVFRAWFVVCAALTLYLFWVVGVEYRVRLHEAGFVLPNVVALLAWWGVFTRTCATWKRVP